MKWVHGSAVKDGVLKFLSVSAAERADQCLRDWSFTYVGGFKEPPNKNTARGTALHLESANYLKTGVKALSSQVVKGLHMFPTPGDDLYVECSLIPTNSDGVEDLSLAPLRAGGVPFVGAIDVRHGRLINYGGSDIEDTRDPEGTVEVIDWKFPTSMNYVKGNNELPKLIQMAGYGIYVFAVSPDITHVRLSHGYMPVSGNPKKATIRVTREDIRPTWDKVDILARSIIDAAKEKDSNKVDANTGHCYRFNRWCMHKPYCTAAMHNSLSSLVGQTTASRLLNKEPPMALLPAPGFKPTAAQQLMLKMRPTEPPTSDTMAEEMAKLKAEEAASMAKRQAADKSFLEVCTKIALCGRGFPTLTGQAAQRYARAGGQQVAEGVQLKGNGELEALVLEDEELIFELLKELETDNPEPPPPALLPPEAPISTPVISTPVTLVDTALASVVAEPAKTRKTRKTRVVEKPEPEAQEEVFGYPVVPFTETPMAFFVNCVGLGSFQRFEPYVMKLNEELSKECGAIDVRCGDTNGPLGYSKWKPVVAAALRETVLPNLAPGNYVFEASSELYEVVAEALREYCIANRLMWVRGMR